jgi:hypothetical protein
MLLYLCVLLICNTCAYTSSKSCINCRWFQNGPNYNPIKYGKCEMFGKKINNNILYEYADHCRNNNYMCGNNGILYENKNSRIMYYTNKLFKYDKKLNELNNQEFGEVTEKKELMYYDNEIKKLKIKIKETSSELKEEINKIYY